VKTRAEIHLRQHSRGVTAQINGPFEKCLADPGLGGHGGGEPTHGVGLADVPW
jgi:hypothetical protein